MYFFYNIFIVLYALVARILSLHNNKAKLWVKGRKSIIKKMQSTIISNENIIWIHSSSLGEFEQGRPLIERIKKQQTQYKILLTFFSPSGFEIRKNYAYADYIFYLPNDTPKQVKAFFDIVQPKMIFFIKYDYWFNYIRQAHLRNIPFYVVSCIFRPQQIYFQCYGKWFLKQIQQITHFFTQDKLSLELLYKNGISQASICGDTRFDRVADMIKGSKEINSISQFCNQQQTIVCGSTWKPDEYILSQLCRQTNYKFIIAPHEIEESRIQEVESLFSETTIIRYSQIENNSNLASAQVLIIDCIGLLSSLYRYATICYIGGGFGKGIHNTLEAATYGKPIIFGPNYQKFKEAIDLINCKSAFSVKNISELSICFNQLNNDKQLLIEAGENAKNYVQSNTNAVDRIYKYIFLN